MGTSLVRDRDMLVKDVDVLVRDRDGDITGEG